MRYLKTNTATIVTVGPFYDKTDGVTIETALTITNERISFVVDANDGSAPTLVLDNVTGATSGTSNDLNYITSNDAGLMQLELAAANVNYLGRAFLSITDAANHCPVFHEFTILPALVYDSLITGGDYLQVDAAQLLGTAFATPATAGVIDVNLKNIANAAVSTTAAQLGVNVVQISTDATAADNAESFFDGTGYAGTNNVIPLVTTTTTATNVTTVNGLAAGVITAAAVATGAIDADALAADAGTELGTAVWATAARTLTAATNVTSTGAAVPITAGGLVSADVTAISTDTTAANNAELMFDGTGYAGGTTKLGVDAVQVGSSATAATNAARGFTGLVLGTAITGTLSTTAFTTDLTEATNDHYKNRTITFTSGVLAGQMATITAYNGTTKTITVAAMTDAPSNTDAFFIA